MTTTEQTTEPVIALSHPAAAHVAVLLAEEGEDGLGLQGAGFSIENPNAQRSCGCGQSFS